MFKSLNHFLAIISVCALWLPLPGAAAGLQWDRTEARIDLHPSENEARADFTVTNTSDNTLRIARVKTSCGCTGSIIDRKIIQPGESTRITATFHKGKRRGLNHNKLQVFLENQKDPVATLHMRVKIPTLVEAKPQIIYWNAQSPQSERVVEIRLDQRYVSEISSIEYDRKRLRIVETPAVDGEANHVLRILPTSFDQQTRQTVRIKARGSDGISGEARLHVFVQP